MAIVKYITLDNTEHEVDVPIGNTLMQSAVDNDIDGIPALCGGCCSCGTCHVYVGESWLTHLPKADEMEQEIIDTTIEPKPNSRLSCQITMSPKLDGMIVHVAESE